MAVTTLAARVDRPWWTQATRLAQSTFKGGDVGYVQKTLLHYIENTDDTDLVFLEMFGKVNRFQDLSFSEWLAHTPPEAVMAHLRIDKATYDAIPKDGGVVMPL